MSEEANAASLYEDLLWSFTGRIAHMTDKELLSRAVAFDVGPEPFINGHVNFEKDGKFWWQPKTGEPLEVEYRYHVQIKFTGSKWVITNGHSFLNKKGEWEFASIPSNQEDDFRQRVRFDNCRDAIIFFQRYRRICWDNHERLKDTLEGRALWEELDRILAEEFKQGPIMF